jgi:hypothetical protein
MGHNKNYIDGWIGFTKRDLIKMYDTNTAQWPVWISISHGSAQGMVFDAEASLLANGLDPNNIPQALADHIFAGKLIKKIAEQIELKYIPTPD